MPWRVVLLFILLSQSLAGCAMNRPLVSSDGPLFGHHGAVAGFQQRLAEPVVEDAGRVVEAVAWSEPVVVADPHAGAVFAEPEGPYYLDTGDRLRVFVYGQPNLSRTYIVDHDGQIPVPLIGNVPARGMTTSSLSHDIARRLGRDFVRDPQVTVDVIQNRPFFILGEVRNAGQYPYVSGMTVETAVAIAGGYTERASRRKYRITRRAEGLSEVFEVPAEHAVKPGDTVLIYERFF